MQISTGNGKLETVERLSALNALLNMDEKGDDAALQCEQVRMDDAQGEA